MPDNLHVVALTAGRRVPSARFRIGQHVAGLAANGVDLEWRPAPVPKYPPAGIWRRPFWLLGSIAGRVPGVLSTIHADVTLLGRELISTLCTLEPLTRRPRVLDVDDAVWMTQKFGGVEKIVDRVDAVFAGNDFVADWFSARCADVTIVPTAVDVKRFRPVERPERETIVIGWSGTAHNLPMLGAVWPALAAVVRDHPNVRIRIVSDRRPLVPAEIEAHLDYVAWSPENEVRTIQDMDVGLMPLPETDWSRGKCSYKMLLYLACGVPVVVTPIGMNEQVLAMAEVGYGARGSGEWGDACTALLGDEGLRKRMGRAGRELVVSRFSLEQVTRMLAVNLKRVAS